ncbi:MAG: phosphoadenylyl-sulfate reductase [Burkholderia sp.]|nr:phosphoadenylyl-sulfate reductase [Burkholderia sp.]
MENYPMRVQQSLSAELIAKTNRLDVLLKRIATCYSHAKFASSLTAEDMLITHVILSKKISINIFLLNTARLHRETVSMIDTVRSHYGYEIKQFYPQQERVNRYITDHGVNAFYESISLRKECCYIRKVEPLNRALSDADAWITGQRRKQSITRSELREEELDNVRGIPKYNPLAYWTDSDIWMYLKTFDIPINPLHERGYSSIGCEPCTRAIRPGESSRAGRWWWESNDTKECGLHI